MPLPSKWVFIEVPMRYAALLPTCVSNCGSCLRNDENSWLWVFVYTDRAASCARHLLWNAYEYQRLTCFPPILFAMIKSSHFSIIFGGQNNADEIAHLISIVESIDWSTVSIVNSRCTKGWNSLTSHSPTRIDMAGDFKRFTLHTRKLYVTISLFGLMNEIVDPTVVFTFQFGVFLRGNEESLWCFNIE